MNEPKRDPVSILLNQKQDFIIIGLTGRTGSGCTTSAKILSDGSKSFPEVTDLPQEEGYDLSELSQKRYDVTRQYANSYFPKFYSIKISDFISAIFVIYGHIWLQLFYLRSICWIHYYCAFFVN